MNYIIDAYNVGHKISSASQYLLKGETEKAIPVILNYIRMSLPGAGQVIAVFDGKAGNFSGIQSSGKIRVKFSQKPQTADDIIRSFIRNQPQPEKWTVVSSDNEIVYTAKDMGARVQSAAEFISRGTSSKRHVENSEKYQPHNVDVDEWLKLFNEGDK